MFKNTVYVSNLRSRYRLEHGWRCPLPQLSFRKTIVLLEQGEGKKDREHCTKSGEVIACISTYPTTVVSGETYLLFVNIIKCRAMAE